MNVFLFALFVSVLFYIDIQGSIGYIVGKHGPADHDESSNEHWAYVTVRPKAHMFYWLYQTTNQNRPLILWLQGGPGGSGTGFGNFNEIGPLDVNLKARNTTWLQVANLLFVDNPVGTGYSYVEDPDSYTTNINEITADLLTLMKAFIKQHDEFQETPFYIFSESYGGKMTAAFSAVLSDAIKNGQINMNFKGFAMGDSWISPLDSVFSWGPFLYANSIVSQRGLEQIRNGAKQCAQYVAEGKFSQATTAWGVLENIVGDVGSGVNFYNINQFPAANSSQSLKNDFSRSPLEKLFDRHVKVMLEDDLSSLMNGPIRKKLKIIPKTVVWGGQSQDVFTYQSDDFMKNVTNTVNDLINKNKDLKVIIYSGQLDLICNVLGTEAWFARLDVSKQFSIVQKQTYTCGTETSACYFSSNYENVYFYWIRGAGHMVPSDNGRGALSMVSRVIQ